MNNNDTPTNTSAKDISEMSDDEIFASMSDEEIIDAFVESILDAKKIDEVTNPELRAKIFNDVKARLTTEIERSLIAELPEDVLDELNAKVEAEGQISSELVAQKIQEAGLNVGEITGQTMVKFREMYLGEDQADRTAEVAGETE